MTAQIRGFVTREQAGLVRPRSISRNIAPQRGGVAIHYGGGPQSAANDGASHTRCVEIWRSWQRYHMSKNYADIAYTGGFCNHGYAFAGRGAGIRTGANGTNESNYLYYAAVWIGGEGQTPTQEALDAADWWLKSLRAAGAGMAVRPHRSFKSTACPGAPLGNYAASRDGRDVPTGAPTPTQPTPTPTSRPTAIVKSIQTHHEVVSDGKWGPNTDSRVMFMRMVSYNKRGWPENRPASFSESQIKMAQRVIDTPDDGIFGPNSRAALDRWIKEMQRRIGVTSDGYWGPQTDGRLLTLRRRYHGNY